MRKEKQRAVSTASLGQMRKISEMKLIDERDF
jgi:hypothetical protein